MFFLMLRFVIQQQLAGAQLSIQPINHALIPILQTTQGILHTFYNNPNQVEFFLSLH